MGSKTPLALQVPLSWCYALLDLCIIFPAPWYLLFLMFFAFVTPLLICFFSCLSFIVLISFIISDIIILAVDRSALGMIVACLPLPLIVLPLRYAIHRLTGSHIQVVTNYRYDI